MDLQHEARPVLEGLRRSTRTTSKPTATADAARPLGSGSSQRKRKATDDVSSNKLDYLLTNTRSKLTQIDISDVLNYSNFLSLSPESQQKLYGLLPPTAFSTYQPTISPTHPDYVSPHGVRSSEEDVAMQEHTAATFEPSTFNSPFFLSAARTFQDHLYSGWLGTKAREKRELFEKGIRDGTLHADWKDEAWEREHTQSKNKDKRMDLTSLAKCGLLKEGDVISYRRKFLHLGVIVEKDILSVESRNHSLTILLSRTPGLHASLLVPGAPDPEKYTQSMEYVTDPDALEDGILDIDGRVSRSERHTDDSPVSGSKSASTAASTTSWKKFTVWRWRDEGMRDGEGHELLEKGGREPLGTLFYLREYCHD